MRTRESDPSAVSLDLLPAAAYLCDAPTGLVTRYNRRAADLWGREPAAGDPGERFSGAWRLYRADGTAMSRAQTAAAEALRTGRTAEAREAVVERPDGSRRRVLESAEPVRDATGALVAALVVAQAAPERAPVAVDDPPAAADPATAADPAAAAARRADALLRTVADNATLGLLVVDTRQRCTFMNAAAERMTGFRLDEVSGRSLHDAVHHTRPDGRPYPREECPIVCALPARGREQGREVLVRKDGTFHPVEYTASPFVEDGVPAGTIIELRDVSDEQRAEAERARLLAAEQAARAEAEEERRTIATLHRIGGVLAAELDIERLLQLLTDEATALTGAQFGAFFYNAVDERGERYSLYTLSGVPREAFAGFPMPRKTQVFGPTFRGEAIVRLEDVTRDARYGQSAPYHGMPPGHLPVRSYLAAPVMSRSGEVLGGLFFGHARPGVFTERHERLLSAVAAQAAVAIDNARLYEQAQQAVQVRDDFLSIASHELKTPLTALQLASQSLERDVGRGEAPDPAKLALLGRQVIRVGELIDTLLDVSRISAGRLDLRLEEIDLAAVVADVAVRLGPALERAGVTLAIDADGPVVGRWDRTRLEQVASNLLSNAIKYGRGRPVGVRVSADDACATLAVRDEGIGIAPEQQARIFERFERAVSTRRYGGFGLGLWIVRRIVEALGGRISVTSAPDEGSTFTVALPRRGPDGQLETSRMDEEAR